MSITFGIYDFFSYFIPGLLYLYCFNEFLRSIGKDAVQINDWIQTGQAPNVIFLIPILIAAYVVGHILDPIAQRIFFKFFYRLRYPDSVVSQCLLEFKRERSPDLEIQFKKDDWGILFTFIRQRNIEMAHILDKLNADSIMLVNIAFGMLLIALIEFGKFLSSLQTTFLLNALGTLTLCILALSRSNQFRMWFFTDIFEASLEYGLSLKEVSAYNKKDNVDSPESAPDTKSKRSENKPLQKK